VGDIIFYDWGGGQGISHASMQVVDYGSNQGYDGSLVDQHDSVTAFHKFWTDKPDNSLWEYSSMYFVHINR